MLRKSADVFSDTHRIVIKDNDNTVFSMTEIINSFISRTACHSTVTDNGNNVIILVVEFIGSGITDSSRYGCRAVSCIKMIIRTLAQTRKTGDTPFFTKGIKLIESSRKELVGIGLMSYVKYYLIFRIIENCKESYSKFYDTKIRSKMSAVFRNDI